MARFVTVSVRCDWGDCRVTAEEGDGTVVEKTVAIDNKQARAFLLCKEHLEDFEEVVVPLMAAGIKVDAPSTGKKKTAAATSGAPTVAAPVNGNGHTQEQITCRVPDCGRSLTNRTGLAQHAIRTHGFEDLAAYEAMYPDSTID